MSDLSYAVDSSTIKEAVRQAVKKAEELATQNLNHAIQTLEAKHEIAHMHAIHDSQAREIQLLNMTIQRLEFFLTEERKTRVLIAQSWGQETPY